MRRFSMSILLAGFGVFGLSMGDEPKGKNQNKGNELPKGNEPIQPANMIPNPNWRPKPGDVAKVYRTDAPSAKTLSLIMAYSKPSDANDTTGIKEFTDKKQIELVEVGTDVLIIQPYGLKPLEGGTYSSPEAMQRDFQDRILRSAGEPKHHVYLEVRIQGGRFKDQVRFLDMESVASMIPKPTESRPVAKAKPKLDTSKPVDPIARAASLLKAADNLEKVGNKKAAIENYRRIVKDFGSTPSAKDAADKLKVLGEKP